MDGRFSQRTHESVAYGKRTEETYTTSGIQLVYIPEGSSREENLTLANQSCLANLHSQTQF